MMYQVFLSILETFIVFGFGALAWKLRMIETGDLDKLSRLTLDMFFPMLTFSTKGSGKGDQVDKVRRATEIALEALKNDPDYNSLNIKLDGELQADAALDAVVGAKKAPGSEVAGKANVLVFPDLASGNISYKMLQRICGCEAYGPMLQGLNAPVNDLSRGALVEDIVGMIAITCIQAQK